jgi:glycosyltransferase involved in cell wall biosynthesis
MNNMRILMLGESFGRQGGIVSVEKLIFQEAPPEMQIQHIATLKDGSSAYKVAVFAKAIGQLVLRLLQTRVDLVHIHLSERGSAFRKVILALIAVGFRKPVIVHAHSADFHVFYSQLPQGIKQGLNWGFCKCARFIVLSESWKKFYLDNLGLKPWQVTVLPNPVKLPPQVPQRSGSNKVSFVFLGRIGKRKGAFDLIEAFAQLPAAHKNRSELILAGDGDVEQACGLVKNLNLMGRITVLDWIDSEQRDQLLAKSDVFVLPSYNEGLPMALLEAMSWGLPAITTPVGGIPELVTSSKNGLLVTPGDIKQLSEAMQFLIENETLRLSLGSAARQTVAAFDVNTYSESLMDIYRSVVVV